MSRKILTYKVTAKGRDLGKVFLLTELSTADAEDWAMQAFFALMNSGVDIPDDVAEMGLAGIASIGLGALGKIDYEKARPLLDRMMTCVQIIPDPSRPNVVRALDPSDIEEVSTRLMLRKEVFALHVDFLTHADRSISAPAKVTSGT
jgi:hypothetical protein